MLACVGVLGVASAAGESTQRSLRFSRPRLPEWMQSLSLPRTRLRTGRDDDASFVIEATRDSDDWVLRVERDSIRVWTRSVVRAAHTWMQTALGS